VETWQTSLRRQYLRRDPGANPLGEEVDVKYEESRDPTAELDDKKEGTSGASDTSRAPAESLPPPDGEGDLKENVEDEGEVNEKEDESVSDVENDSGEVRNKLLRNYDNTVLIYLKPTRAQTKDWADLTMLQKLDSIHMIMEWHFHNPSRFRQVMKSDDEYASWVSNFDDILRGMRIMLISNSVLNPLDTTRNRTRTGTSVVRIPPPTHRKPLLRHPGSSSS
jgi:hypothetical protein